MKCPQCLKHQKYAYGMICRTCGYRFALNPKASPITDMGMQNATHLLSGDGQHYFTYNQLFAQVWRIMRKKQRRGIPASCVILFLFAIGLNMLGLPVFSIC